MEYKKIAFIGAGNMATAIISGLIGKSYPKECISVAAPHIEHCQALQEKFGIKVASDNARAVQDADIIVLAVKPQMMQVAVASFSHIETKNKLVVSIAAGISSRRLNELFDASISLVRVMPNTPALLGLGMSGLYATPNTSAQDKSFAFELLSAVGECFWVKTEQDIDKVTCVSGSGPAYFFLFMEAMQKEAMRQGFDEDSARLMVQQTAIGAAKMVIDNPQTPIAVLRQNVTSKGGTTAAALDIFDKAHTSDIVSKAMQAAFTRAQEMEKLF